MRIDGIIESKKLVIFGAGANGRRIAAAYADRIAYFVDNSPKAEEACGLPTRSPRDLCNEDKDNLFIIVASEYYYHEISEQLIKMGFEKNRHFTSYIAFLPLSETISQFPVHRLIVFITNICNSRCTMCNVWQNTAGGEGGVMPLSRYQKSIGDPFHLGVRSLRLSGGEPSLAKNLPEYVHAAVDMLPALNEVVLNLNCLLVKLTLNQIRASALECAQYGISLIASLSLNGIEDAHDAGRGVPGNYNKVMEVIHGIREMDLPNVIIQISARIIKDNVWNADEFAMILKRENLTRNVMLLCGRFATLNNSKYEGSDCFDEDELYQIKLLYNKLPYHFPNEYNAMAYDSFLRTLEGGERLTSCCIETGNDVAVTFDGSYKFCPAVSNDIGNLLYTDARTAYKIGRPHLKNISKTACDHCYCCSSMDMTEQYQKAMEAKVYWNAFYTLDNFLQNRDMCLDALEITPKRDERYTILITGWYGTETVGDKAILGQIISDLHQKYQNVRILVTSAYPFVTKRTLKELKAYDVQVVELFNSQALEWAVLADETIMGGGPLMEMEWLSIPLWLFSFAKRHVRKTVVWGCGIGPLYTKKAIDAVVGILKLADKITLRDSASADWAMVHSDRRDLTVIEDPAIPYIRSRYKAERQECKNGELACFLRELTQEYVVCETKEEFELFRMRVEEALAQNIKELCSAEGLVPHFYTMHNFVVGNDDRDFAFRFTHDHFVKGTYAIDNRLTSIEKVTEAMNAAALNVCMRFHSVAFADTLEVPYVAIDYTFGGKVFAFMNEHGQQDRMATIDSLLESSGALLKAAGHVL